MCASRDLDLGELIAIREALYGPALAARITRWLRGPKHGAGDKRGRWRYGKKVLRRVPWWVWEGTLPFTIEVGRLRWRRTSG